MASSPYPSPPKEEREPNWSPSKVHGFKARMLFGEFSPQPSPPEEEREFSKAWWL